MSFSTRMYSSAAVLLWCLMVGAAGNEPPVSGEEPAKPPEEIVLGMSTAVTGPAAELGRNMRDGVMAALAEANAHGGIKGKRLRLIVLDDGYEPERTAPNVRRLIEEDRVVAVVGNVGTPTAVVAIPIASARGTPFYGAYTGAGVLRKRPPDRYVINFRASYAQETAAMVNALVETAGLDPAEIAFFTQRDAYGDAGFNGGIDALLRHGLANEHAVVHARYERNTLAVEGGLADVLRARPKARAIIMVGAYAPCAEFIRVAREVGWDGLFVNVSFVGASALARTLGPAGEGVIITQVVPHFEAKLPIVEEYRRALSANEPTAAPSFGSLEGYISTRILCMALEDSEDPLSREALVDALENLGEIDVGLGLPLRLGPNRHQASQQVWATIIRDGRVVPFDWKELAR